MLNILYSWFICYFNEISSLIIRKIKFLVSENYPRNNAALKLELINRKIVRVSDNSDIV